MRNSLSFLMGVVLAIFLIAPRMRAQNPLEEDPNTVGGAQAPKLKASTGPAPVHDISGVWLGPVIPRREPFAPMTPWAQKQFDSHKPSSGPRSVGVALSDDPLVKCDPLGFPRNVIFETRGFEVTQSPKKVYLLYQYQRIWREVWTDGHKLPTDVGGTANDSPDPRWYGYSVGKWADDYTFVISTTGMDERSWLDEFGHPHSVQGHVEERYRRVDANHLELTVTVDDPTAYTKPFEAMKQLFQLSPQAEFDEQMCVPSEAQDYLKIIANPAISKSNSQ